MKRSSILLEARDIGKEYQGTVQTRALRMVNLNIHEGEFVAIVGPSGAGKSTLLNVLGLLDRPTSGSYRINGEDTSHMSNRVLDSLRAREFGFVFQSSHGLEGRTAAKNVELPLITLGIPFRARQGLIKQALADVGLTSKSETLLERLSGGEKQRVAIARAIVHRPSIILLDEPTGNLDSESSSAVLSLLHDLNARGTTVILVTHDRDIADGADRRIEVIDGAVDSAPLSENEAVRTVESRPRPRIRFVDIVGDALFTLAGHPIRSILLVLVVALGAAGIVAALGLSQSASAQINDVLATEALDEVQIVALPAPGGSSAAPLGLRQVAIIRGLDGVVDAGIKWPLAKTDTSVSRLAESMPSHETFSGSVVGATSGFLRVEGISLLQDQADLLDQATLNSRVAFLGRKAADELGVSAAGPGVKIWLSGRPFDVAAIFDSAQRNPNLLHAIVISPAGVQDILGIQASPTMIVRTEPGMSQPVGKVAKLALDPIAPESYGLQTTSDLASLRHDVSESLGQLVLVIGIVFLIVATFVVASSQANSVMNRQQEIGVRRAVGWPKRVVGLLFFVEGVAIGFTGGLVGAALGTAAVTVIAIFQKWSPVLQESTAVFAAIAGLTSGAIAALIPAFRASQVEPADAVRL